MMLMTILNVVYVLLAIGMIAMILMQRGAGAQAGSGFGGGASATVFGSRGASNFLSKSTKWLAIVFFGISLGMAWYATHSAGRTAPGAQDLGVMAQTPAAPAATTPAAPAGDGTVPAAPSAAPAQQPASTVPAAPQPQNAPVQQAPAQTPPAASGQPQPSVPQGG